MIGSMTKIRLKENKTCNVFFESGVWSQPGGVYCAANKRKVRSTKTNFIYTGKILIVLPRG